MARTRNHNTPAANESVPFPTDAGLDKFLHDLFGTSPNESASPVHMEQFCIVPEKILKSNNVTIVFWKDGTKTLVRCAEGTEPNDYNAFTAALAIRLFGSNTHLKKVIQDKTIVQKLKKPKNNPVQEGGAEA